MILALTLAFAADVKDKVKFEAISAGLPPGMDPGMYVCAAGHLHIKGTVQNMSDTVLGRVCVEGKAYDAQGQLLGTATAATKSDTLGPNEKAEINLEFVTITGSKIRQVTRHEEIIARAATRP
jgi:hypothetical protein